MQQLLVIVLVRLAVAASIASLLTRSGRFLNLLLREQRSVLKRVHLALGIAMFGFVASLVRVTTQTYVAADFTLEGSMLAGITGGYVSGLLAGVVTSLPSMFAGEYLSMPVYAAAGVLGGLVRDLAPDPDEIWRFSPFVDLSIYRLIRYPADRRRTLYHVSILAAILLAELMRFLSLQLFGKNSIFTLYADRHWGETAIVFVSTIFAVSIPLKTWNSARTERLLEAKERLLVEARLSALASQINPHFLFNTLNTVSSLIRTNPDQARRVVYKLSAILRRLLRKTDNFSPLRDELSFIEDYLSIEMVRFGEKLKFVKEVSEDVLDCQVPAMLLQPLVENSIKHGLANKLDGGTIRLSAARAESGRLTLLVEDNGAGIEERKLETLLENSGIGVSNVNERLQVLFGDNYQLRIESKPGEGTRTEIELPV